jgi:hypothetical protein
VKLLALTFSLLLVLGSCAWAEGTTLRKNKFGHDQVFVSFPVKWNFTCDFPEKFKADVRDGFRYWDDMTKKDLFQEVPCGTINKPDQGIAVGWSMKEYLEDGEKEKVAGTAYIFPGLEVPTGGAIMFWKDWLTERNGNIRRSVSRHEVGHLLGFEHNTRWDSCLMYPYVSTDRVSYEGHEKQACWSEYRAFIRNYR